MSPITNLKVKVGKQRGCLDKKKRNVYFLNENFFIPLLTYDE